MKVPVRVVVCYLLWGMVSHQGFAQNQPMIDSLLNLLETDVSAREQVDVYVKLAQQYLPHDTLKVAAYADQAIQLAEKISYPEGKIDAMYILARLNRSRGNYAEAEAHYKQMVEASKRIQYQLGEAWGYSGMGSVNVHQGNYQEGLACYRKALHLYEAIGRKSGISSCYNNIGNIYYFQGDYDHALEYFLKGLNIDEELGDQAGMGSSYNNIAGVYRLQGRLEQALDYYFKSLGIKQRLENQAGVAEAYHNIGTVLYNLGDVEQALDYSLRSLDIIQALGDKTRLPTVYMTIGLVYMEQGQGKEALANYLMALEIAEELGNTLEITQACHRLGGLCHSQGDEEKAMAYLGRALALSKKLEANDLTCMSLTTMADIYRKQGAYARAKEYLTEAMSLAQEIGVVNLIRDAAHISSQVEASLENYQAAYQSHVLFKAMADSLQNEAQTRNIARIEAEYAYKQERDSIAYANETQRLALENDIEQARTIQRSAFSAISLLVILLVLLLLFYHSNKRSNKLLSQQAQQLKTLDESKSRFFANISHELRTPLTLVSSPLTQVLAEVGPQLDGAQRQLLTIAQENTFQLKELVDDILDLSRLESSRLQLEERRVNIGGLIQLCASNFDSLAQHLLIDFEPKVDAALLHTWVSLDRRKFGKILNNLLSNAIKFTPSNGRVALAAEKQAASLVLTVRDTGSGISPEDLPYIFDRFTQSQQPERMMQGGSGIGLAIVKEYTQLMQGTITVTSELEKGSAFTLTLPLREVEPPAAEDAAEEAAEEVLEVEDLAEMPEPLSPSSLPALALGEREFTILIVEDHPQMQQFVRSLLQARFRTRVAHNGLKALEVLEHEPVDLIISDVMMPQMDGFALVGRLKSSEAYFRIPVILLTALGGEEHKIKGLMLGVNDYLPKPFSPRELWVRVHNLLQRSVAAQAGEAPAAGDAAPEDAALAELEVHPRDLAWLQQVKEAIGAELQNEQFLMSDLAERFHLSERQFRRKLSQLTGLSPKQYQQEITLQLARELLETGKYETVKEVAYTVGMQSPARFSKLYEARFGKKPREFVGR